jgi:hypothetical protein
MAKTTYLAIPPGLEDDYWSALQPQDRLVISRVRVKNVFLSDKKLKKLERRSLLFQCSEIWKTFTEEQKRAWKEVDFRPKKNGWQTFVADQCIRIKLGLPGTATPNIYHQDMVGAIIIESPATEIKLIQPHPFAYWIAKKVKGKKNMWEPVEVNEFLSLPLKIGLSFKTNLTPAGNNPSAKFYARILHTYQGQNLWDNLEINLPLNSDWQRQEATRTSLIGQAIMYNLYIHLKDVQGEMLFDNVVAIHSGQNWARDIYCKKIEQSFTRGFWQVPKHWAPVILPEGAGYKSIYPIS